MEMDAPNLTTAITDWSRKAPAAPAILTAAGTLSFAELDRAINWTADSFMRAGLASGNRVGLQLANQIQQLISSLALARLGAGQIAFNLSDGPQFRGDLIRRLSLAAIITDQASTNGSGAPAVGPPPDTLSDLKSLPTMTFDPAVGGDLPYIIAPTSGTSAGRPKLGMINQQLGKLRGRASGHLLPDGPGCIFLALGDVAFQSMKRRALAILYSGGCVALRTGTENTSQLIDFIAEGGINYLSGTAVHASALLQEAPAGPVLLPGLNAIRMSSTLIADNLREEILDRLTPKLFVTYGLTEFGTVAVATPGQVAAIAGVVGTLVPGAEAAIVDDRGQQLPAGEPGHLRVKSDTLVGGYLGAPLASEEAFHDGWFDTGDLVTMTSEGCLIHHGRADDVMILDGINIHPAEIESALLRHPAVAETAAFSVQADIRGDLPMVAVVLKEKTSAKLLIKFGHAELGSRRPRGVMILDALPRNAAGKVLRNQLIAEYQRRHGENLDQ